MKIISIRREGKVYARMLASQDFMRGFESVNGRKPTREEGLSFGNGFNVGWKMRGKVDDYNQNLLLSELRKKVLYDSKGNRNFLKSGLEVLRMVDESLMVDESFLSFAKMRDGMSKVNILKAAKKVAAIGTGVAMLGVILTGALA